MKGWKSTALTSVMSALGSASCAHQAWLCSIVNFPNQFPRFLTIDHSLWTRLNQFWPQQNYLQGNTTFVKETNYPKLTNYWNIDIPSKAWQRHVWIAYEYLKCPWSTSMITSRNNWTRWKTWEIHQLWNSLKGNSRFVELHHPQERTKDLYAMLS